MLGMCQDCVQVWVFIGIARKGVFFYSARPRPSAPNEIQSIVIKNDHFSKMKLTELL